ncbi:macro domain-like protein [Obba rivulosa]|uniref:Macro domain-like protein n=1 Tax=Obba rivulosa TaxID=1052685 RepID=A0A8E2J5S0_9APHY|nr:macro domain-like protein [Obba rivulosa]
MADKPIVILISPAPRPLRKPSVPPRPLLCDAWNRAIEEYFADSNQVPFTVVEGKFNDVEPAVLRCDCIVSPANLFGITEGNFDLKLSYSFKGAGDEWRLTDHCQLFIRDRWHGYTTPGSCMIIPLQEDVAGKHNPWNASCTAIVLTIRTPEDVSWHRDIVYNSMWSLLAEISLWNRFCADNSERNMIQTVLMTGLGTRQGGIGAEKAARQMILAVKHFLDDLPFPVRWKDVQTRTKEVEVLTEL